MVAIVWVSLPLLSHSLLPAQLALVQLDLLILAHSGADDAAHRQHQPESTDTDGYESNVEMVEDVHTDRVLQQHNVFSHR